VRAAETNVAQARSAVERGRLDLARLEVQSRVEGEKLKIALANAERHVKEAEQTLEGERLATAADVASGRQKREKASFDVNETERIIAAMTIRAPKAGAVSLMPNYRAGGTSRSAPEFKRGDRAWFGAPIAELPDLSSVQLVCRVDEADRARIQAGLRARVNVDALPDRDLAGTIDQIAIVAKPDFTTWPPVRNFDVAVSLADGDKRLRSGMSATARVEIDRLDDVVLVPTGAVFQHAGDAIAYVVAGRSVQRRSIVMLRRNRDQMAIRSGLREGERVALQEPDAGGSR
jgi:HlyD family secretion protein